MRSNKQKSLRTRKKVLAALRELRPTCTYKEISERIGVGVSNIKRIYSLYCETIEKTPKARARIHGISNERKFEIKDELFEMRNQGATFKEIGRRFNISSVSAYTIYFWLLKKQKQMELEELEEIKNDERVWLDEQLVLKYLKEKQFDLPPMFFIINYKVTHRTAQIICARLKKLKESVNE